MFSMSDLPRIPFADYIDQFVDWLTLTFGGFFDGITNGLAGTVNGIVAALGVIPSIILTLIFAGIAWWISTRGVALFTLIGFLLIDYLGYWRTNAANTCARSDSCGHFYRDRGSDRYLGITEGNGA